MTEESRTGTRDTTDTRRGTFLVLVSAAAFGGLPIFAKLAYSEGVNLMTLLTLRFSLAAAIMWALWAVEVARGQERRPKPGRSLVVALVAMGAIGYVGQSFSYFTAVTIISATATSLLLYTYPIIVAVLSRIVYKEKLTGQKLVALLLAAAGAMLVLGLASSVLSQGGSGLGELQPAGVAWALSASVVYSAYIVAGARITAGVSPIFSSAVIISSAAITYVTWSALSGELRLGVSGMGLVWASGLALISTVLAISTFFAGLRRVGPSRAAIISTLEPTVTVFLAALILRESVTLEQIGGGILILAAVIVLQIEPKDRRTGQL